MSAYAVDSSLRRSLNPFLSATSSRPPYVHMRQNKYSLSICSSPPISMLSANMAASSPRHVLNIPTSDNLSLGLQRNTCTKRFTAFVFKRNKQNLLQVAFLKGSAY